MHFVGLDLAWSVNKQSGIAVIDAAGDLLHVDAKLHQDDIVDALAPFVGGDCVVAIDAPLIVKNATGQRPAERDLNADFGRFEAGAYPANTTMPVFASGLRGAAIAEVLGLDIDPHADASRRAIEVYPHPATVSLFGLGRTLKYKGGRGRSVADRKAALLRLMTLIDGLAHAVPPLAVSDSPHWTELQAAVKAATRPVHLDRAEDPVDAVICAYVAMYALRRPDDVVTYGDTETGYIVTPTLPRDLKPTPRAKRHHSMTPLGTNPFPSDDAPNVRPLREFGGFFAVSARSRTRACLTNRAARG